MKILFLSHYFPPEGNAPASRVYEMAKRWVADGHEVSVVTCAPNVPDGVVYSGYRNKLRQVETFEGIRVVRVWTWIAANEGTFRRIMNYLSYMFSAVFWSLLLKKPDVVIATSPQFFCGWAGVLLKRLKKLPFILEIRDIWPESIVAVGAMKNKRLLRFLEYLEKKMYASADHIVAVGEGYRQKLIEKGIPAGKISIVMNGIDTEVFFPRSPDRNLRKKYRLQGKFVCSYIGTIGMACGLDVLLRASRLLKERGRSGFVFLVVGDGAVRKQLEEQAHAEQLDTIIFVGRQPKEMIPVFLSVTDACLVHLKRADLFKTVMPSKIFEAAGMAKPIIIGVPGFAAQLVSQSQGGIEIEPENERQLIQALETLHANRDTACRYGLSGHEYITSHFNRDQLSEDYLRIIELIVNSDCSSSKKQKTTGFKVVATGELP